LKNIIIRLSFFVFGHTHGENIGCDAARRELDSLVFNESIFDKYFYQIWDTNQCLFKTDRKLLWRLRGIATYNTYLGNILPNEVIKVQFQFSDLEKIKNASYYYQGRKITLTFNPESDGFSLNFKSSMEGTNKGVTFSERKNGKTDGIEINYYSSPLYDSFILEKKFYKAGLQTGKYLSYYRNGQIKIEGDSVLSINVHNVKVPKYNSRGEIVKYILGKDFDTEKRGIWKYYDYNGNLIKEEKY